MKKTVDVLVVGAGPVGLFCAHELRRHGLRCRIIDKKQTISDKSKALAIHIRTLDMLNDCGLLTAILAQGHKVEGAVIKSEHRQLVNADFNHITANYHYLIDLPQNKTEAILAQQLHSQNLTIEWQTELTAIEQHPAYVNAMINKADGDVENIQATWVIACDGAHSTLRHLVGAEFKGAAYQQSWWLADLKIDWAVADNKMVIYLSKHGPLACFPMGKQRYRLVMTAPIAHCSDPTAADIQRVFQQRSSDQAVLFKPIWLSQFNIHHRQIQQYRHGQVFFAGDAAHIHSPMGGQGLNTGMQDIYNLVWKLALVHKGYAQAKLLDSYHAERFPIGKAILSKTDLMTRLILLKNPMLIYLRNLFLKKMAAIAPINQAMIKDLAELTISYAQSPIVKQLGSGTAFKKGEALVDFSLINALTKHQTSCLQITQGTQHHLFLFSGENYDLASLIHAAVTISERFAELIVPHLVLVKSLDTAIPCSAFIDEQQRVHKQFVLKKATALLIRPDKYIGLIQSPLEINQLIASLNKAYLQ